MRIDKLRVRNFKRFEAFEISLHPRFTLLVGEDGTGKTSDELDVHLHPGWQRRVASDLKTTFPSIQFVCTSHSPQIISELPLEEMRLLDGEGAAAPDGFNAGDTNR